METKTLFYKKCFLPSLLKKALCLSTILFLLISISSFNFNSQILTFDFVALAGGEASANSNFNNVNLNSSTITRGAGLTAAANGGRFNATSWALTSIANAVSGSDYMQFTVSPSAGYQFTVSSITIQLQRSSTGLSSIALRSSFDAYATNLDAVKIVVDNTITQTFTFTFAQSPACDASITYRLYGFAEDVTGSAGPGDGAGDDISINGTVSSCGSNSITTGSITGAPFDVSCSAGDAGSIDLTSVGSFTAGNVYTAQLSNSSGGFGSPLDIGSSASTLNSGSISLTIPFAVNTGSGYLIRIVSSNPAVTGSLSSSFNINLSGGPCTPKKPFITSVMLDGCDCSGSIEGRSEIVFANSGGISINTSNANNIDLDYTSNGAQEMLLFFRDGSSITTALNTASGCSGTFVDGRNTTIPPNAKMMFVSSAFCQSSYNTWSNYCGTGPIYVLYGQDGPSSTTDGWVTGGNFSNNSASNFDLVTIGTDGITYRTRYNYSTVNASFNEGNYVIYSNDYSFQETEYSSETTYRTPSAAGALASCAIVILPLDYKSFEVESKNKSALLSWTTYSERNNDYFEIEMADENFVSFVKKGSISGSGTSSIESSYSYLIEDLQEGYYYFRLKQVDLDGEFSYSEILTSTIAGDELTILNINSHSDKLELDFNKELPKGTRVSICDISGKLLQEQINSYDSNAIEITAKIKGLLFINIEHPEFGAKTFRVLLNDF